MQIEKVNIETLIEDPSNARKHSEKNLAAIKGSLAKFGQQKAIVVGPNNVVIAGNGTLAAARALGWQDIYIHRTDLKGIDLTGFAIADNRTGELAEWDMSILGDTLQGLREESFDLGVIGFDLGDWEKLFGENKEIDGATELDEKDFQDFDEKCPRCGFEFDEGKKK